ncbi:MAG: hypothetical protein LBD67_07870 [Candidatus Accumulibacter sp.]|nr:hypothetical protein [Accumulibacter sp.]
MKICLENDGYQERLEIKQNFDSVALTGIAGWSKRSPARQFSWNDETPGGKTR